MSLPDTYMLGYRQALTDLNRCGALNPQRTEDTPGLCLRKEGHTGKHDDLYRPPWGDAHATVDQNRGDPRFEVASRSGE